MRVFTFFLMVAVALGGGLAGYRLITGRDLLDPAEFGLAQSASAPPVVTATAAPPPPVPPTPTSEPAPPPATPTPLPDEPQTMVVGNTDGLGAYLRRTPRAEDKLRAWVDGTRMAILGGSMESEGRKWRKVRAPDGAEGYLPEEYLLEAPPR